MDSTYKILMDVKTQSYYMEPNDFNFHVYQETPEHNIKNPNIRIVDTDMDDAKELKTKLYNDGFYAGYIDGKHIRIPKTEVYFFDRNPNEICYAQYLQTKEAKYLEIINKRDLLTLCRLEDDKAFFPVVQLDTGEAAILAYTDTNRMPQVLFTKYTNWRSVRLTFDAKCIVNGTFIVE